MSEFKGTFAAIDFETADAKRDSACAVAVVRVENGHIVDSLYRLVQPPRSNFSPFCVRVHHIRWKDVENEPVFADVWPQFSPLFKGVDFVAAHNASFDRSVLSACLTSAGMPVADTRFLCTVKLARKVWPNLMNHKLNTVSDHLGITLQHHHAGSDAEACARIAIEGLRLQPQLAAPNML
ncbi:3'-5' exonuclease [Halodesulfovibrio sp.]|jgi:DNA polymerase-3 subunit epsilon|uniref:3'-5' exonuclease n=1 Tax=Halodesulfovibrio sp. TaxID=1912772 RepID=UPI0025CF0276|nr:3'-5' exonuclease [Halodesulfovibrio sp.]MCT4536265.1 3'-5' exonuclease [Halodesulfovibrio sp.]MCT4626909.1 3'-5' exonuclease [Halodesulfovibrio sp.]